LAQVEIFEFLKTQRIKGEEQHFTATEIYKALQETCSITKNKVYVALLKLEAFGYLDPIRKGKVSNFSRAFKLKDKYIPCKAEKGKIGCE